MSLTEQFKYLIYSRDPTAWISHHIKRSELNQPFALYPHQREILQLAFAFDDDGKLPWDTILYSCPKKSGKTSVLAILALWWGMTQEAPNELVLVANDLEQVQSRAFSTVARLLRYNLEIDPQATVSAKEIRLSNDSTIKAIASEYSSAAGSNHGLTG